MGEIDGASERDRTSDLLITNQPLYRLSYAGPKWRNYSRDALLCPGRALALELLSLPLGIAGIEDLGAGLGRHVQDLQAEGPGSAFVPAPDDLGAGWSRVGLVGQGAQEIDLRTGDEVEIQVEDELQAGPRKIVDSGLFGHPVLAFDLDDLCGEHTFEPQELALLFIHAGIIGDRFRKNKGQAPELSFLVPLKLVARSGRGIIKITRGNRQAPFPRTGELTMMGTRESARDQTGCPETPPRNSPSKREYTI